ncbi:replicative DNA helicase [Candidatus Woesebacteria bacterium]|nr:replicative DNA helicase [Candidatus Woesebacteria bacterium]
MALVRIPPNNIPAEESVLGALLLDHDAIVAVAELLKPEFFYKDIHQDVFRAIIELYSQRSPIDIVTVSSQLKKNKALKEVGGTPFLTQLAEAVPTSSHVREYAKIVKDLYTKRQLISLAAELNELAFDEGKMTEEILDKAESSVFALSQTHVEKGFIPLKDVLAESFDRLDELQKNAGGLRGVPTGFADLDDTLSGMQASNLLILAARPGVGKTAFSLNIAMQTAVAYKKKVAYFSLEMSKEELVDRLLVAQADIDAWRLKTGRLSEDDFTKLSDAMGVLADAPIYIDDTPGITVLELRTKARRLMSERGIDMIVVDYLQLMHGSGLYKENRVLEIGEISMGLKNIARELKVPVLSLAQLSRAVESRGTKQPQLSDLRESGSIEQDADVVMFLYREDDDERENVKLGIAKHRNGALRNIDLFFKGDRIRFYGVERRQSIAPTM